MINAVARGRSNVAPKSIPWEMLRTLITETYGGKIDSESDFQELRSLVNRYLTAAAFEENFHPVDGADALVLPSGTGKTDFLDWINALPERELPTYLGLPANAEKLLLTAHAEEMVRNTRTVMDVLDEGEAVMAEAPDVEA